MNKFDTYIQVGKTGAMTLATAATLTACGGGGNTGDQSPSVPTIPPAVPTAPDTAPGTRPPVVPTHGRLSTEVIDINGTQVNDILAGVVDPQGLPVTATAEDEGCSTKVNADGSTDLEYIPTEAREGIAQCDVIYINNAGAQATTTFEGQQDTRLSYPETIFVNTVARGPYTFDPFVGEGIKNVIAVKQVTGDVGTLAYKDRKIVFTPPYNRSGTATITLEVEGLPLPKDDAE